MGKGLAEDAVDVAKEAAKDAAEAVDSAMDAAVAALTGSMVVDFEDGKGACHQLCFQNQKLGFAIGLSGGGCCAPKTTAKVVVKKVDKAGQAAARGVEVGWKLCGINGMEVTGHEQARKLLASEVAKLPKE